MNNGFVKDFIDFLTFFLFSYFPHQNNDIFYAFSTKTNVNVRETMVFTEKFEVSDDLIQMFYSELLLLV